MKIGAVRVPPAPEAAQGERAAVVVERRVLPAAAVRTVVIQGQVLLQMRCYGLQRRNGLSQHGYITRPRHPRAISWEAWVPPRASCVRKGTQQKG